MTLDDFERPLNDRGKRDAPVMVERARRHGFLPDKILCSSAKRTRKTLSYFLKGLAFKKDEVIFSDALYLASAEEIMEILSSLPNHCHRAMLVGHNPGLTDFVNRYSHIRVDNLPTSAICCIRYDVEDWSELKTGNGDVLYLEYPRLFSI